jgi:hypothetical protein
LDCFKARTEWRTAFAQTWIDETLRTEKLSRESVTVLNDVARVGKETAAAASTLSFISVT